MKKFTNITGVLSWINLIIGGLITLFGLIQALMGGGIVAILQLLLIGSVVLHSYAALQLRKSIVNPEFPLDSKTPTGIRFIGFLALMLGVGCVFQGVQVIGNTKELIDQVELPEMPKEINVEKMFRGVGYFVLVFGLSVAINVLLNISLLKWYRQREQG
ncbi:hypothetical protein [Parasegetibacter sp. NRK P23]|uniref:hypothetical protein n=1 Tax=Parasegetibacter sp. NRK P23 TaxID=2942999 RepID=UPI0020435159|nr:hypothetical protein [Parasegetibacter sp. NRK P23]MCM5530429.1 hypothetical protein [Parasegetibacter sp. NRK P23]